MEVATQVGNLQVAQLLRNRGIQSRLLEAFGHGNEVEVREIIKAKLPVDIPDYKTGHTPLHMAAERGWTSVVEVLVQSGAHVNVTDKVGGTPLYYAAWRGNITCVELLLKAGADIDAQGFHGDTALHVAAQEGHLQIAQLLISRSKAVNAKR